MARQHLPAPETASRSDVDEALIEALHERDLILENAGVGIVFVKNRVVQRCNQRYLEIFGVADETTVLGHSSQTVYPDKDAFNQVGAEAYPVLAAGQVYRTERPMRRADGELIWCSLTGRQVRQGDVAAGSIWIIEDIDERKRAEAALQKVTLEQQLIFDHAMVGIVFLRNRRVTRCNRAFEQLFDYGPGELDGSSSREWYLSDEDWQAAGRRCYEPFMRGETFQGEMLLRNRHGEPLWCEVRSKAIDPQDLYKGSIWIAMNITARKQAEAALVQAKMDLEALVQQRTQQLSETVGALEQKIREQHEAEAHIQRLAHFDGLTQLPNRTLLQDRASQAIDIARRHHEPLAVLFLDVDHFKKINDSLGHRAGDELLRQLALRLKQSVREQDTVSRLGGDEFVLLLPDTDMGGATHVARKIMEAAGQAMQVEHTELSITPSIGIAMFPGDGRDFETLCQCADVAMYRAKRDGRNGYCFFTPEMQAQSLRALTLENALRRALQRRQLHLVYQPQIRAADGAVIGVEALLRWQHPELGAISPAEFIPVAESSGLILPIGEWVLNEALQQLQQWMEQGLPPMSLAVNLSAVQFRHGDLPSLVARCLDKVVIDARWLELELTEGVAMNDPQAAMAVMRELHQLGVRMSIDDFGTGYSSLNYLKQFRVAKLKIDQSFVRDLEDDPDDRAIVRAIISMAGSLGLETIAEGVETRGQLAFLIEQGCTEVQGYLFSRPLTPEALADFVGQTLKRRRPSSTRRSSSPSGA